ncbi:MAG: hypothetical protein JO263_11680 [Candidatus Eremiobacteraeota bacterium]|nr:hypothetical protein [Candidatus Eremiobacteraeota bacterium]
MRPRLLQPRAIAPLLAAAMLSACAGHGSNALLPSLPSSVASSVLAPMAAPPSCKGEKLKKKYGSLTVTLKTSGGSFCIPAFGGFGGSIEYPSTNPPIKLKLTSSTSDYNHKLPPLSSGNPIFYLQLGISGATVFGTNVPAGGGLAGKKILPAHTYTAFGQATLSGFSVPLTPCWVKAKKGKYGGMIGGLGTLLKGQTVPGAASGLIEIYPGKLASGKC